MQENFQIDAITRNDTGKSASRHLRREGMVPGIIYGGGKDPQMVSAPHNKLALNLEQEAFYSRILKVNVDGQSEKVVLKDLQRHPSKPFITHFDLLRVSDTDRIKMFIPFHFLGEDIAPGVKAGGIISHNMSDIEVSCLPKDLPEFIEIDISALDMGQSMHLSEVALPKGVELAHATDANNPVAAIHSKGGTEEEEPSEASDEEEAA